MRYSLMGYKLEIATSLDLDLIDLAILYWFEGFIASGKMQTHTKDGEKYYWINNQKLCNDLSILKMKKKSIYRRLTVLTQKKILKKIMLQDICKRLFYSFDENYYTLKVSDKDKKEPTKELKKEQPKNSNVITINPSINQASKPTNISADIFAKFPQDEEEIEIHPNATSKIPDEQPGNLDNQLSNLDSYLGNLDNQLSNLDSYPGDFDSQSEHLDSQPRDFDYLPGNLDSYPGNPDDQQYINKLNINHRSSNADISNTYLAKLMFKKLRAANPHIRQPKIKHWESAFESMIKNQGLNPHTLKELIEWVYQADNFWCYRILTPYDLRDKYERLMSCKIYDRIKSRGKVMPVDEKNIFRTPAGDYDLSNYELVR